MPCQTCGAVALEDDVYCQGCLDHVHAELADALLEGFLEACWSRQHPAMRAHPWANARRWQRSA
jgi:hypothetical protein